MKTVPLGEIIRKSGSRAKEDTAYPVYSVTKHGGFVPSEQYFKKQVFSKDLSTYTRVKAGEFAYATIHLDEGSIGIAPVDCLISPMYTVFAVDQNAADPNYLIKQLKSPPAIAQYDRLGNGSVHRRRSIPLSALSQLNVPLPALDEQRRIAAILDKADAIRQKRRQAIDRLDTLTQSVFHEMFGSTQEFKPVSELASHESRSIRTGPFGSQLLHEEFTSEGAPVLGIDNVVDNRFKWKQRRFIDEAKFRQLEKYEVFAGDVLITIMGTTGRCAVVPADIPPSINTKHLCAITPNTNLILPDFLQMAFLNHPRTQRFLKDNTRGAIMAGLNMGIIKQTPIPVPSVARQEEFVNRTRRIEYAKSQMNKALETDLYESLQSRAFRGEL